MKSQSYCSGAEWPVWKWEFSDGINHILTQGPYDFMDLIEYACMYKLLLL